ncbi:hypothetical protein [Pontibacter rugosus]
MKHLYFLISFVILMVCFASCSSVRESPKYQFSSGVYKIRTTAGEPAFKAYVDVEEDSLVFQRIGLQSMHADSIQVITTAEVANTVDNLLYTFSKPSFDLDVLTIPFKYRPGTAGFPQQLNTTFQGAIYVGARKDVFRIRYRKTPVNDYHKSENHFGYSIGLFSGIGATTMNEWVTQESAL